ncbi:hypothetical protein [Gloeothece verrucosa]|uniref:Low temperature-induced protein n=1 Tax=Gloeothece verrucosa (strain PCC 7822) TaxID=497965 RepID=E0UI14_GLOV7|nr:hypothetical protein [Gloeothece verrucosa]ADN15666.1 hypothetical protein Cyan7822_3730 [Gloeothece verrucosa PCC 7822]
MKKTIFTLCLAFGTTLGIVASYSSSASAQLIPNSKNPEVKYQSNEENSSVDNSLGGLNPLDLIHNANLRRSRDASQFQEDSDSNLNQAAQDFKRKQQQMMQNPSSGSQVPTRN